MSEITPHVVYYIYPLRVKQRYISMVQNWFLLSASTLRLYQWWRKRIIINVPEIFPPTRIMWVKDPYITSMDGIYRHVSIVLRDPFSSQIVTYRCFVMRPSHLSWTHIASFGVWTDALSFLWCMIMRTLVFLWWKSCFHTFTSVHMNKLSNNWHRRLYIVGTIVRSDDTRGPMKKQAGDEYRLF